MYEQLTAKSSIRQCLKSLNLFLVRMNWRFVLLLVYVTDVIQAGTDSFIFEGQPSSSTGEKKIFSIVLLFSHENFQKAFKQRGAF